MKVNDILNRIDIILQHTDNKSDYHTRVIEIRDTITFLVYCSSNKEDKHNIDKDTIKDELQKSVNEWNIYQWKIINDICYNRACKQLDIDCSADKIMYIQVLKGQGGLDVEELQYMLLNVYYKFIYNFDSSAWIDDDKIFLSNIKLFCTLHSSEQVVYKIVRISPYCNKKQTSFIKIVCYIENIDKYSIDTKDLFIEATKSSGAGGQHVNKTNSAIRIVHIPTGVSVFVSNERSQSMNKRIAFKRIAEKLNSMRNIEKQKHKQNVYKHARKIALGSHYDRIINLHQNRYIDIKLIDKKIYINDIESINLCEIVLLVFYNSL